MKITVHNSEGGVGKMPISANIAIDKGFMIATNDTPQYMNIFFPMMNLSKLI